MPRSGKNPALVRILQDRFAHESGFIDLVNGRETDFRYVRWADDQIVTEDTCVLYVEQDPGPVDILCDLIGIKHHSIFNTSQIPVT